VKHRGILLTLKGTVIRSGGVKMIEGEREYQCRKCSHRFVMLFKRLPVLAEIETLAFASSVDL
jgi:DNA-directed RNA polymerase subunit RPC12/RpoP